MAASDCGFIIARVNEKQETELSGSDGAPVFHKSLDQVNRNKLWKVTLTDKGFLQHLMTVVQRLRLDTIISTNSNCLKHRNSTNESRSKTRVLTITHTLEHVDKKATQWRYTAKYHFRKNQNILHTDLFADD
jgi:hypothetical protein